MKLLPSILLCALLLGGMVPVSASTHPPASSAESGQQNAFPPTVHQLYFSQTASFLLLDAQGNPLPPDTPILSPLANLATGETAYYTCTKTQDTGRREEGYPVTQTLSRLYAPDGTLLRDWEEVIYREAFGGLVIRSDPYFPIFIDAVEEDISSALWDPATGKTVVQDAFFVVSLSRHRYLLSGPNGLPIGVTDQTGALLSRAPQGLYRFSSPATGGYFIAKGMEEEPQYLLDQQFQPVLTAAQIFSGRQSLVGDFLLISQSGEPDAVYLDPTKPPVYTLPRKEDSLEYFDGSLAILNTGPSRRQPRLHLLRVADGQVLAEGFDTLAFLDSKDGSPLFLGRRGEAVQLLDRQGKILAQTAIPGVEGLSILSPQLFACYTDSGEHRRAALLSRDLSVLLPGERYNHISLHCNPRQQEGRTVSCCLLYATHTTSQGELRTDILTLTGEPLIQNLTQYSVFPQGIAVLQGFHYGLMDWDGNWITRHPIFTMQLQD